MVNRSLKFAVALMLTIGLAGCSSNSNSGGSVATKQAEVNSKPGMAGGGAPTTQASTGAPAATAPVSGGARSGAQN